MTTSFKIQEFFSHSNTSTSKTQPQHFVHTLKCCFQSSKQSTTLGRQKFVMSTIILCWNAYSTEHRSCPSKGVHDAKYVNIHIRMGQGGISPRPCPHRVFWNPPEGWCNFYSHLTPPLNPIEELFSSRRWKVHIWPPPMIRDVPPEFREGCMPGHTVSVEDCQGWIRHSLCMAREAIRCDTDENLGLNPEDQVD